MRMLEGVFPPDTGTILVDGAPVAFREPREAHAARHPGHPPGAGDRARSDGRGEHLRRRDAAPAGIFLDWRRLEEQTRAVLAVSAWTGIAARPRSSAPRLGPAQRQMIEIMRAVRAGGRLIAFDEPTSSLTDEEARRLFAHDSAAHAAEGVSVVYISHRLHEIIELADRVAVLRDGRLVADRPAAGLTEREISQLMVGRELLFAGALCGDLRLQLRHHVGVAQRVTSSRARPSAMSRKRRRMILPERVFGRSSAQTIRFGRANLPIRSAKPWRESLDQLV